MRFGGSHRPVVVRWMQVVRMHIVRMHAKEQVEGILRNEASLIFVPFDFDGVAGGQRMLFIGSDRFGNEATSFLKQAQGVEGFVKAALGGCH